MDIKSEKIEFLDIDKIIENPRNANRHSIEQIERLEKLIKYQGFRNPLIISKRTGFLIAGHGRLIASKNLGMKQVPVIYQDFENEAQEFAYLISDNEIARWAELDKQSLYDSLEEIKIPSIELLGIENFNIDEIKLDQPEIEGDIEFTKEIDEKNDYIVLLFDTRNDFNNAVEKLGIAKEKLNLSRNGQNENLEIIGLGRIIRGNDVIDRI